MKRRNRPKVSLFMLIVLALGAGSAHATSIQDLVRIKGHERSVVMGMGLVVGLNGTGDTAKDSYVAARPFARLLTNLGNPVIDIAELEAADAFAIVNVTMHIPPTGARDGDRFDVTVDKMFNASSLEGGRLVVSLLRLPGPDSGDNLPLAFAEGALVIEGTNPGTAVIRRGGQMLVDVRSNPVSRGGSMTLVLKEQYAGYPVAATIADAVNDEFAIDGYSNISRVEDAKNIRVRIPEADRPEPAAFIATLMTIPIDPSLLRTEARIVMNERRGIITVTGDVEIGPVAITQRGLQLTNIAPPDPAALPEETAPGPPRRWVGLDTTGGTGRSSTRLTDLLAAFDQLNVPTEDQMAIIFELRKTGALHAEIVTQ